VISPDEIGLATPLHGHVGRELGREQLRAVFTERAIALGVNVLGAAPESCDGDRVLRASGAVAVTGSVILTGDQAARRPLLAANRLVVHVDLATVVAHVSEAGPALTLGDALILTGASRTADIEKQIVRGIHGPEDLVVVLAG
jgi:hypothetical protein